MAQTKDRNFSEMFSELYREVDFTYQKLSLNQIWILIDSMRLKVSYFMIWG